MAPKDKKDVYTLIGIRADLGCIEQEPYFNCL